MRILYEKPSHGYQLIDEVEQISCGCHRLETGSIYTLLRRMEHRGLVESEWKRSESTGPERRIYRVTDMGKEALRNGLESIARRKTMMDDLAEFYRKNFPEAEKGGETT